MCVRGGGAASCFIAHRPPLHKPWPRKTCYCQLRDRPCSKIRRRNQYFIRSTALDYAHHQSPHCIARIASNASVWTEAASKSKQPLTKHILPIGNRYKLWSHYSSARWRSCVDPSDGITYPSRSALSLLSLLLFLFSCSSHCCLLRWPATTLRMIAGSPSWAACMTSPSL